MPRGWSAFRLYFMHAPMQQWRPSRRPEKGDRLMSVQTSRAHGGAWLKINVSSGPSKEIADLKKMMMMKMMTPGSQDSRVWEFSHEALKVRRSLLGLCVDTYGPL